MSASEKTLYRTRDGLIAGVCGGIARYFGIDAGVVRLFAVVLSVLTCGVLAVIYLALWLVLPKEPATAATVDVAPQSIASETYGQVANGESCPIRPPAPPTVGAGHIPPPVPPASASYAGERVYASYAAAPAPARPVSEPAAAVRDPLSRSVRVGLAAGIALVTIGIAALISNWVMVFSVFQFWPLLLVAAGIARMVIPDSDGYHMHAIVGGLVLFLIGATLLMQTLGIVLIHFDAWFDQVWPVALIAIGLIIMGRAMASHALMILAAVLIVIVCLLGLIVYSDPGPAQSVWVPLPFDQGVTLDWKD